MEDDTLFELNDDYLLPILLLLVSRNPLDYRRVWSTRISQSSSHVEAPNLQKVE